MGGGHDRRHLLALCAGGAGNATFDTNGNNVTLGSALSGTGAITKTGTGTLTLGGANTYRAARRSDAGLINFAAA